MIKKYNPLSLRSKILYAAFIGMLSGIIISLLVNALGTALVQRVFLSPENIERRYALIAEDFSQYVRETGISGKEYAAISEWTQRHPNVTLLVYSRSRSAVNANNFYGGEADSRLSNAEPEGTSFLIHFSDGFYRVFVAEHSEGRLNKYVSIATVISGSASVIAAVMIYARRLTLRISQLTNEAAQVSGGDLDHVIPSTGSDELSSLAGSMNNMRQSVISRMGEEQRAWQANAELLTAISHDIRTPLTSMIGYLGLLSEEGFADEERARQFTESAYAKALELKQLTDELFRYFLVFGKAQPDMNIELLDGDLLLRQMLSELEYDLTDSGFTVRSICALRSCQVSTDPVQLSRVMGNLISNVKKYADREKQVTVITELCGQMLSLCISNYIVQGASKTESTKIGLMTCTKLMECMGGSFTVREDGTHFSAELHIPLAPPSDAFTA